MAEILRGEIYWANLNPIVENDHTVQRPVLILSKHVFNKYSGTVIGIALTSQPQRAGFPLTLELDERLPQHSWAKISQIRTLSTKRLGKKIGKASAKELELIISGLNEIIGISS